MEPRLADYFLTVGLGDQVEALEIPREEMDWAARTGTPITDIAVVFARNEKVPPGFTKIEATPNGRSANINPLVIKSGPIYLCYKCGSDKPPIVEISVYYSYKTYEIPRGHEVIARSAEGKHEANLNSGGRFPTYLTFRRSPHFGHQKAITDLAIIHESENIPPGYQCLKNNLNKGLGHRIFTCYKSAVVRPPGTCFKPNILSRYPDIDYEDFPLTTEHLPMFCLPVGVSVELWNEHTSFPLPTYSTFVLTSTEAIKMYGATVLFYESLQTHKKIDEIRSLVKTTDSNQQLYVNKCICLLSRWPFFAEFKSFLSTIYRLSLSQGCILPLERYIQNLMDDCPFPTMDRPRVMIDFGIERFYFTLTLQTRLPFVGLVHWSLLVSLDVYNLLRLITLVLLEQKVVVHSSRPALLTAVGEAICSILFPLSWQCCYIPMCPLALATYIQAPVPFIIGIDSRYTMMAEDVPDDVTFVDLDKNNIKSPKDVLALLECCKIPKKCTRPLKKTLKELSLKVSRLDLGSDLAVDLAPPGYHGDSYKGEIRQVDTAIREAFLTFNAMLLQDYGKFLRPIDSPPGDYPKAVNRLFDSKDFIKKHPTSDKAFLEFFTDTQLFCSFVENRSFSSNEDSTYAFFDECIEKIKNNPDEKLLANYGIGLTHEESRTQVAPPPDTADLPNGHLYTYETFPLLDPKLFSKRSHQSHDSNEVPSATQVHQRTKAEKQRSTELLQIATDSPEKWSKALLSKVYTLWFLHLPTLVKRHWNKRAVLDAAHQVMQRLHKAQLPITDQVCYRILMDQYTKGGKPAMAVKVMSELQQSGNQANAVTYGFYNQAMVDRKWPLSRKYWKLYKYVFGACWFLQQLMRKSKMQKFLKEVESSEKIYPPSVTTCLSPKRSENGTVGVGIPLMERITSFPLYDPTLDVETEIPSQTPHMKKRISQFMHHSPQQPKLRRTSVHRSTPTRPISSNRWALNSIQRHILEMTTCSMCPSCNCLVYDEDIMANWFPSESEYNTRCPYCESKFVPKLTIRLRKIEPSKRKVGVAANLPQANGGPAKRLVSKPELEVPSNLSQMQLRGHARSSSLPSVANEMPPPPDITENILLGPLFHPYLSPVVLRKELETHLRLGNELLSNDFMTESPVLFWNMLWYFSRTGLQSYFLNQLAENLDLTKEVSANSLAVDIWWDMFPEGDDQYPPLYSRRDDGIETMARRIDCGNVSGAVYQIMCDKRHTSAIRTVYRDIGLLVCALQGPQFDPDQFDAVFDVAKERITHKEHKERLAHLLPRDTILPSPKSRQCRSLFWPKTNLQENT